MINICLYGASGKMGKAVISAAEVNLFFLLETIIGPGWVWFFINEQPTLETIQGGSIIILTIAIHSFLKIKNL